MTQDLMFERVHDAYDIDLLQRSRVVVVGCGGARGFVETLARTGVGEFVLIDPDTSSLPNVGTQAAFRSEAGRPKVEALRARLEEINQLRVLALQRRFQDVEPSQIEYLLRAGWGAEQAPRQSLLVLTTDSFEAQAHGNRVALHFGIPSAAAQVYQNGAAAEFTYTHPQVTPACHRCALDARYEHYLQRGFRNNVTSHGTPVFCADRVNAMLGMICLMLLHHGSAHPRWGAMLARAGARNLILAQLWPDTPLGVFDKVLGNADRERLFFDNTVWLPQKADHPDSNGCPACPDCGGTGNLTRAIGSFVHDLYQMRPPRIELATASTSNP